MNRFIRWPPARPSFLQEYPLSKISVGMWCVVGLFIWTSMALADINLIINVVIFTFLAYLVVRILKEHVLVHKFYLRKRIRGQFVSFALALAISTAWWYSAFISGAWDPIHKIPSSCFWFVHLHHWMWSAAVLSGMLYIVFLTKKKSELVTLSYFAFLACTVLVGLLMFFFVIHGLFPDDSSFWIVLMALIPFSLALGVLLRSNETESRWFVVFMAMSFGVAFGIFTQGFAFAFIEFAADNPDPFRYVGGTQFCS